MARRRAATAARGHLAEQHAADPDSIGRYQARMARLSAVRRRAHADAGDWCILRTNAQQTLILAETLEESGIEAWTPMEVRRRRLPRGRKGHVTRDEAIMPSFVFARAAHLPDLLRVLAMPSSPHPRFTIFQQAGRAPLVRDGEIQRLRDLEERALTTILKGRRPDVQVGQAVRPSEGAFAGLDGVIEQVAGRTAHVLFNGTFRVQIGTWLLIGNDVEAVISPSGIAA